MRQMIGVDGCCSGWLTVRSHREFECRDNVGALARTLRAPLAVSGPSFRAVRMKLSHYPVLGLEFQLATDILATAVTPD